MPEAPFENRPECEAGNDIARPMRQDRNASERQPDRNRADRPPGTSWQPAGRRCQSMCSAWPEGNASFRLPESGTPCICPITVRRSGRVWSNTSFKSSGSSDAVTVTGRAWFPARRSGTPQPREASQPTAVRTRRSFSSAPQVRARATCSGAGAVLRAIECATATSALVGLTFTGKLGLRPRRLADKLAILNMSQRSKR